MVDLIRKQKVQALRDNLAFLVLGFLGKRKLSGVFLLLFPLEDAAAEVTGVLMSAFRGAESKVAEVFMNSFKFGASNPRAGLGPAG